MEAFLAVEVLATAKNMALRTELGLNGHWPSSVLPQSELHLLIYFSREIQFPCKGIGNQGLPTG